MVPDQIGVPTGDTNSKPRGLDGGSISSEFPVEGRVIKGALKNAPHFFSNYARQLSIPAKIEFLCTAHLRLQQSHIRKDPAKIKDLKLNRK